jgi:Cys-tRNA(Pro)/Cys-tRNA(Cys) deacylase
MPKGATPALVALDAAGISYKLHEYEHRQDADSFGLEAAQALGVAAERVFKTLVAEVDGTPVNAIIPASGRLSLKALAAAAGGKKAELAKPAAAERATGYVVGGISPLGQRRQLRTFVDAGALRHESVYISAGRRGLQIELSPHDLVRLTNGHVTALA